MSSSSDAHEEVCDHEQDRDSIRPAEARDSIDRRLLVRFDGQAIEIARQLHAESFGGRVARPGIAPHRAIANRQRRPCGASPGPPCAGSSNQPSSAPSA